MNIVQTIRLETESYRSKTAIIDGDRFVSYDQLLQQVAQLTQLLADKNIRTGQRIAFHCGDGLDYVVGSLALLACGAAVVPVADNITEQEVAEIIDRVAVQGLLIHTNVVRTAGVTDAQQLSDKFFWKARDAISESDDRCREMGAAFIRFSSGTTGDSKGVVLSHQSILDRTDAANQGLGITSDDVICWVLGMSYHFVVSILLFLRRGACIVVANQFFPFSLLEAVSKHPITFIYASPVHYHLLGMSNAVVPSALEKVRLAISTSMKMPVEVSVNFSRKFGFSPAEAYGIIEIGLPFINTQPRSKSPQMITPETQTAEIYSTGTESAGSVGQVLPDYQLRIRNPDADGIGEVLIKGKGMFDAYFSPWRSRADCTDDGWFHTGDLGRVDDRARLFLVGRSKTILVCAGMKIFPEEIEQVINTMPGVKESMVFGRDHAQLGQMPIAHVVLTDSVSDPDALLAELRDFCRQKLSAYKIPIEFTKVDSLPKTPSGKIARSAGR